MVTHTAKPEEWGDQKREGKVPTAPGERAPGWERATARGEPADFSPPPPHCPALVPVGTFGGVSRLKTPGSDSLSWTPSSSRPEWADRRLLPRGSCPLLRFLACPRPGPAGWRRCTSAPGTCSAVRVFLRSDAWRGRPAGWGCCVPLNCAGYLRGDPRGLI